MSERRPFLFLDSPRVGGIGHAFVLVPGERTPREAQLASLSTKARTSQSDKFDLIAVQHPVLQPDTNRQGTELLICAGAIPETADCIEVIRGVLDALWSGEVTNADLHQDKLTKRAALIYEAPCMRRIADRFYADSKVQAVRWKAAEWKPDEPVPQSGRPGAPVTEPVWQRFRRLPMVMKLIILTLLFAIAIIVSGVARPKRVEAPQQPSRIAEADRVENWEFLAEGDWPRLLQATGGRLLAEKLSEILPKIDRGSSSERSDHKKGTARGEEPASDNDRKMFQEKSQEIRSDIDKWSKTFAEEFALGAAAPESLKSSRVPQYLTRSKATNGKATVGAWIGNYMNQQRDHCPDGIMKQARALETFSRIAGDPPPEELPKRVRRIWKALEVFSTSTNEDLRSFRECLAAEFKKSTPPPDDYETLTVKDAQRMEIVKTILGSKEFGAVAVYSEFKDDESDWGKIRRRIEDSLTAARTGEGKEPRDVLLRAVDELFRKPTSPP